MFLPWKNCLYTLGQYPVEMKWDKLAEIKYISFKLQKKINYAILQHEATDSGVTIRYLTRMSMEKVQVFLNFWPQLYMHPPHALLNLAMFYSIPLFSLARNYIPCKTNL